jgi:hypothetical protein
MSRVKSSSSLDHGLWNVITMILVMETIIYVVGNLFSLKPISNQKDGMHAVKKKKEEKRNGEQSINSVFLWF